MAWVNPYSLPARLSPTLPLSHSPTLPLSHSPTLPLSHSPIHSFSGEGVGRSHPSSYSKHLFLYRDFNKILSILNII
ncbi:hypothetical protein [Argonema antarcticum]|uniref:hypothetical protein n=1 Tax=Argonema antarcticum TaxID=2942763 RepID=UPI0020130634|nr:hypothetical protein [Argonema antarcticum]MCL1472476.1 hypothetical protein [Argonema antarcticum A004/B2]